MKDTLYIVMPAYNEEENIEKVIKSWYRILEGKSEDSRLVVADSGSTDNTHTLLCIMQESYPQLEILSDTRKEHGAKVIALYKQAIKNKAEYIFQTDSDGQTNPAEFDSFWKERGEYDGIFGNRKVRGDGWARAFVEKVVCLLVRKYFGVKIPDANAPFRLMRTGSVERYLDKLPEDYNIPNIMITTYFAYYGERIKFEEISFRPRVGGVNSIHLGKIAKIGWKALKDFSVFKGEMIDNEHKTAF